MLKRLVKKSVLTGVLVGTLLVASVTVWGISSQVEGKLFTLNPLLSNPKGYALTTGYKNITAKCSASKDGVINSQTKSSYASTGGSVETNYVSGPTFASSGTTFKSTHRGYNSTGIYQIKSNSKSY